MTDLSDEELERYARHIVLPQIGGVGQRKLKAARVAIVGAGGIGSAAIPALAGAGVGRLTIIDDDVVDRTNLHRQLIFRDDQIGRPKAELAAEFVRRSTRTSMSLQSGSDSTAANAEELLSGHDLVIDGSDNFATRLVVGDALTRLGIPLVSAAAVQFQGQVALFRGWQADKPCYRCFVGDAFDTEDCDTCAEVGRARRVAVRWLAVSRRSWRSRRLRGSARWRDASPLAGSAELAPDSRAQGPRRADACGGEMRRLHDLDAKDREILTCSRRTAGGPIPRSHG